MPGDRETPRVRVLSACARLGRDEVVARCTALLRGDDPEPDTVVILGGAHGRQLLGDGVPPDQAYWLRVWAARGLLWAGVAEADQGAIAALRRGLDDDAWRVREMCAKVAARHLIGEVVDRLAELADDPTPRVRAAAARAVAHITAAGA